MVDELAEEEEFIFNLLDHRGRLATWLDKYVSPAVYNRIAEEHHIMTQGEALGH